MGPLKKKPVPVVVCSHDCDIENPKLRTGVILAPLLGYPQHPEPERQAQLRESRRPDSDSKYHYINLFPLEFDDTSLGLGDRMVVEFSAMLSAGRSKEAIRVLKGKKVLEMTDETREDFRQKLAAFFGRGE